MLPNWVRSGKLQLLIVSIDFARGDPVDGTLPATYNAALVSIERLQLP